MCLLRASTDGPGRCDGGTLRTLLRRATSNERNGRWSTPRIDSHVNAVVLVEADGWALTARDDPVRINPTGPYN